MFMLWLFILFVFKWKYIYTFNSITGILKIRINLVLDDGKGDLNVKMGWIGNAQLKI